MMNRNLLMDQALNKKKRCIFDSHSYKFAACQELLARLEAETLHTLLLTNVALMNLAHQGAVVSREGAMGFALAQQANVLQLALGITAALAAGYVQLWADHGVFEGVWGHPIREGQVLNLPGGNLHLDRVLAVLLLQLDSAETLACLT
jgi:hypothetical protein